MSRGGTSSYRRSDWTSFPQRVRGAVERAERLNFELCVRPEIGRLLAVLAAGLPDDSVVGETGTGTGAGLAWMACSAKPTVQFVSYEIDEQRAESARGLFEDLGNVHVAAARRAGTATAVVTFDVRQARAAPAVGLDVVGD